MNHYVALLRGINVSGKNLIKMSSLKEMLLNEGFYDVQTYIQSGNVLFSSKLNSTIELEKQIEQLIEKHFDLKVPVLVLTENQLLEIKENNPFTVENKFDPKFIHLTIFENDLDKIQLPELEKKRQVNEEIYFWKNTIFLYCPNGYGNTKLNNQFLESKFLMKATTRNWNTFNKILALFPTLKTQNNTI